MDVPFFKPRTQKKIVIRGQGKGAQDETSSSSLSDAEKDESKNSTLANRRKQRRGRDLVYTTSKKRRAELNNLQESSSEDEEEHSLEVGVTYKSTSTGDRTGPRDMGATARSEIDTDYTKDYRAQHERIQGLLKKEKEAPEEEAGEGTSAPKIYRGIAMYGAKEQEDTVKGSGINRYGPIRASQYMRASVRWDYAPDICKDYKETGFCTFGDSCKFMHDRSDYKHGWEIERDWEAGKLKEAKEDEFLVTESEDEDQLPFSCFICRNSFHNPVITRCKHYFCEKCALDHHRKTKRCAACNEKTEGIFNVARDILAKMAERNRNKTQEDKATVADDEAIELPKDEKCTEGDDANNSDNGNTDEPDTD